MTKFLAVIGGLFLALVACGACAVAGSGDPAKFNTPSKPYTLGSAAPQTAAQAPAALPPGYVTGNGMLVVGTDIQPGTYRTAGPPPGEAMPYCYWKRLKGFDGSLDQIIASGVASQEGQAQVVTIKPTDAAFDTSRCQAWQKIK